MRRVMMPELGGSQYIVGAVSIKQRKSVQMWPEMSTPSLLTYRRKRNSRPFSRRPTVREPGEPCHMSRVIYLYCLIYLPRDR